MNDREERYAAIHKAITDNQPVTESDIDFLKAYDIAVLEINMDRRDIPINTYIDIANKYTQMKKDLL